MNIRDSNKWAYLIWAGYPGQTGGFAIASIVFGQYNPDGRLPITLYPASYVNAVSMFGMRMRPTQPLAIHGPMRRANRSSTFKRSSG